MSEASDASFLLYGVCRTEAADATLSSVIERERGVDDAPLSLLSDASLALLQSPVDPTGLRSPESSTLLTYRDVIEAVHAVGPIVPLQFGTTIETEEQGRALLEQHQAALRQHLDRFDGRVEVGVRLILAEAEEGRQDFPPEAESGTAYLKARRDERTRRTARRTQMIEAYRQAVAPVEVDGAWDRKSEQEGIFSLAFLVPREKVEAACARLADVEVEGVEEAHIVGPWAPYSFVEL